MGHCRIAWEGQVSLQKEGLGSPSLMPFHWSPCLSDFLSTYCDSVLLVTGDPDVNQTLPAPAFNNPQMVEHSEPMHRSQLCY